jgi:hypothetical protein
MEHLHPQQAKSPATLRTNSLLYNEGTTMNICTHMVLQLLKTHCKATSVLTSNIFHRAYYGESRYERWAVSGNGGQEKLVLMLNQC